MVGESQAECKGDGPMNESEEVKRLIRWFCWYLNCDFGELARRVGVDETTLRRWGNEARLTRANLARLARAAELSMAIIDAVVLPTLAALRASQAGEEEVFRGMADVVRQLTACADDLGRAAVADLFTWLSEQTGMAKESAAAQWERLKSCSAAELLFLVETRPELLSRELAVLLANASEDAAADEPGRALAVARAAHRLAERVGREEGESGALAGWCLTFVANVERVASDFAAADGTIAQALRRWKAAAEQDRALLPGWRLLDLEGSLRRDQGRYPEALARLSDAEAAAPPEDGARILVKRAVTLVHMEDPEGALALLDQAEPRADGVRDPRLLWTIHINRGTVLVDLGRHEEAERHWPKIEAALVPGKALDEVLMVWLRARIDAGLGKLAEAREGFDRARREYEKRTMAANYAVVSLERAVLDLKEGRYAEVRELAEEMAWIFKSKGLHDEALAALRLFRTAAKREALTVDLAERMVRYLYRAQYDPKLKFQG